MQTIGIETKSVFHDSLKMFHGSLENIMGTKFDILILELNKHESLELWNKIRSELRRLDNLFNRFNSASEVSKINNKAANSRVYVNPEMFSILKDCKDYYIRTLGLFDITLYDFSKVLLDERDFSVTFSEKSISLDFGGYAKGFALKKLKH